LATRSDTRKEASTIRQFMYRDTNNVDYIRIIIPGKIRATEIVTEVLKKHCTQQQENIQVQPLQNLAILRISLAKRKYCSLKLEA
jgi:hypothetical protein